MRPSKYAMHCGNCGKPRRRVHPPFDGVALYCYAVDGKNWLPGGYCSLSCAQEYDRSRKPAVPALAAPVA
jgi:hypothetical protein